MSDNRFTHLNKSQARAVAEAFTTQAETFRNIQAIHEKDHAAEVEKWGRWHEFTQRTSGIIAGYRLAAQDAEDRAAEAREITEGKQ